MKNEVLERFNIIAGQNHQSVDLDRLSSAQRARFISWVRENNFSLADEGGFQTDETSYQVKHNLESDTSVSDEANIGTDIQFVPELFVKSSTDLKSNPEFLGIFSPIEIAFAETKLEPLLTLAGIFAAKEAVIKAGYNGEGKQNLSNLIVLHDEHGKPQIPGYSLSISHSKDYALAFAIKQVLPSKSKPILSNLKEQEGVQTDRITLEQSRAHTKGFSKSATFVLIFVISYLVVHSDRLFVWINHLFN